MIMIILHSVPYWKVFYLRISFIFLYSEKSLECYILTLRKALASVENVDPLALALVCLPGFLPSASPYVIVC